MNGSNACPQCGTRLSASLGEELCPHCLFGLALSSQEAPDSIDALAPTVDLPAGTLAPGAVLGDRYRIRKLLGRGGMGEVWRAYDLKLRVDVALKSLHTEWLANERMLETLRQEVRLARQVVSPNVCRVFDLVELDGSELVTMEYVDGATLLKVLAERAPLDLEEARGIAAQLLAGLEAIHDAGLIHRDLKPENLMLTRAGRVVIMDFGIAKGLAEGQTGTVAGTPGYMAPEQLHGGGGDARADLYSVGVVLAEMVAPGGLPTKEAREAIWQGAHHDPPQIAETPWAAVIRKAVARNPEDRWPSTSALARALEEVTLRVAGAETLQPYPGLSSFSAQDADYFFGREYEIEAVWKKLRHAHLLALIGPSGAGKSSFLRAGLLPAMPAGWTAIVATPGNRPLASLAQALARELTGDPQAIEQLPNFDQPDVAVSLVERWRKRHEQALVVVDQFEELFTLNPPETQQSFAELLARLAFEANTRVVVSMRDDFLFRCHDHEALAPLFSELTPLGPPTGAALRRAVVQPALKCGYRFEDDALVDDMLREVEGERGALPMLAFAAAQLWNRRDREQGLLTREAYEQIGGVAGALAQHAETTMEKVGQERAPVVRELFRNLVTAQGTRAVRERDELLSVFAEGEERSAATSVLDALIDARLLTSYDIPADDEQRQERHRIEIVHESLLSNWPRLVRWQTQDADGAQLRDQVRQAAQMWEQHSRSDDLLWTGTAYQEFRLWKERYPGNLSEQEEQFARAMEVNATKRRRRRRFATAAVVAFALGVAAVTSLLWQRSETARQEALASQLLALGRLALETHPTAALAYATRSLEFADTPEARRFAAEVLWRQPPARLVPDRNSLNLAFSPDGRWLATGGTQVRLFSRDGSASDWIGSENGYQPWSGWVAFSADSEMLLRLYRSPAEREPWAPVLERWRLPGLEALPERRWDRATHFFPPTARGLVGFHPLDAEAIDFEVDLWASPPFPLEIAEPLRLGTWIREGIPPSAGFKIDPAGARILWARGNELLLRPLDFRSVGDEVEVTEHERELRKFAFSPDGDVVASTDLAQQEIRLFSLAGGNVEPILRVAGGATPEPISTTTLSSDGSRMAMASRAGGAAYLWDLETPLDGEPLVLAKRDGGLGYRVAFTADGDWLASLHATTVSLWPMRLPYVRVLHAWEGTSYLGDLTFSRDSRWLLGCSNGAPARLWPLARGSGEPRTLPIECLRADFDRTGQHLLVGGRGGMVAIHSLQSRETLRSPAATSTQTWAVAFNADDRRAAAAPHINIAREDATLQIWDIDSGIVRELDLVDGCWEEGEWNHVSCTVFELRFTPDGRLLSAGPGGIRAWDLTTGEAEWLAGPEPTMTAGFDLSSDGRYLLTVTGEVDPATGAISRLEHRWRDLGDGTERILPGLPTTSIVSDRSGTQVALDPSGQIYAIGSADGTVFVGRVAGGEPHMLLGHRGPVHQVEISPDGRWVASRTEDEIRLWPMPDLARTPLHALPHDELLAKLGQLTNLRAVEDPDSTNGWKLDIGPFPGWAEVPTW